MTEYRIKPLEFIEDGTGFFIATVPDDDYGDIEYHINHVRHTAPMGESKFFWWWENEYGYAESQGLYVDTFEEARAACEKHHQGRISKHLNPVVNHA